MLFSVSLAALTENLSKPLTLKMTRSAQVESSMQDATVRAEKKIYDASGHGRNSSILWLTGETCPHCLTLLQFLGGVSPSSFT